MIALVLGCAECVWEDAERALSLLTPDAIFCVKDMMARWPSRVDYGVTLHPERTDGYMRIREKLGYNTDFQVWAHRNVGGSRIRHKTSFDWAGSSGLFAVKIAKEQGFDGIVLAGVPMEGDQGHIVRKEFWTEAKLFHNGWVKRQSEIAPFVRSMSGWTMRTFREPDSAWLQTVGNTIPDEETLIKLKGMGLIGDAAPELVP